MQVPGKLVADFFFFFKVVNPQTVQPVNNSSNCQYYEEFKPPGLVPFGEEDEFELNGFRPDSVFIRGFYLKGIGTRRDSYKRNKILIALIYPVIVLFIYFISKSYFLM